MTPQAVPAAILVGLAAVVSLFLAIYAWQRRSAPLGFAFAVMMIGESIWALGALSEPLVVELPVKRLLLNFRLLGTAVAVVGLLAFVLRFTGLARWLRPLRFGLICVPFVPILLMAWTDPWLHLYWSDFRLEQTDPDQVWIAAREPGPGYWIFLLYGYTLAAVSSYLLVRSITRLGGVHRSQAAVMLFGVLLPWVVDILDVLQVWGFIPVDLVSVSFAVTGLTFLPALSRLRLLDLTPVAWAAVIRRMTDTVIVLDEQGRVAALNPAACRMIGRPEIEVLGMEASKVFESWIPLAALLERIREPAQEPNQEVLCPCLELDRYYEAVLSRLTDQERSAGWVLVVCDITESRGAAEQTKRMRAEQEARAEAEAANRAKDVFLAMLSHELRTPLTPVLATVSAMLEDTDLDASLRAPLKMIRRNIRLEAKLIDNLLDLTRISQGLLSLEFETLNAHDMINQAIEICADEMHDAGLLLKSQLRADEHHVQGDATGIQQVLWNLLKNAIKFSPPGKTILVRSYNRDLPGSEGERPRLVIDVVDEGIGIEPEALPRIFELFERGGPARGRTYGGLGLGLAISHALADRHGGRLSGFSEGAGKGAVFTLELPTCVPAPASVAPVTVSATPARMMTPEKPPRSLRLLLVEDNKDTLRSLSDQLKKRGHWVRTASTLASALEIVREPELDLDLLVSDIELPDGDGHELMAELRFRSSVPGIALSGFGASGDISQSLASGFSEHLTKPVEFRVLEESIQRVAGQGFSPTSAAGSRSARGI